MTMSKPPDSVTDNECATPAGALDGSHPANRADTRAGNGESQAVNSAPNGSATPPQEPKRGLAVFQIVGSVFAAGLGVQSSKNRERDFKQGRAGAFVVAGIVFTVLFIAGVYTIVSLVLANR